MTEILEGGPIVQGLVPCAMLDPSCGLVVHFPQAVTKSAPLGTLETRLDPSRLQLAPFTAWQTVDSVRMRACLGRHGGLSVRSGGELRFQCRRAIILTDKE